MIRKFFGKYGLFTFTLFGGVLLMLFVSTSCSRPKYTCPAYYSAFNSPGCMPLDSGIIRVLVHPPRRDTSFLVTVSINFVDTTVETKKEIMEDIIVDPYWEYLMTAVKEDPTYVDGELYIEKGKHRLIKRIKPRKKEKYHKRVLMEHDCMCCDTTELSDSTYVDEPIIEDRPKKEKKRKGEVPPGSETEWEIETENTKIK